MSEKRVNKAKRLVMRPEFRSRQEKAEKGRRAYDRKREDRAWKREFSVAA
jgi:stalled ribosome alternative rescue factor ArfA